METKIIQAHLEPETIAKLEKLPWADDKSKAIRAIIEGFFNLSSKEQKEYIKKATTRKIAVSRHK